MDVDDKPCCVGEFLQFDFPQPDKVGDLAKRIAAVALLTAARFARARAQAAKNASEAISSSTSGESFIPPLSQKAPAKSP